MKVLIIGIGGVGDIVKSLKLVTVLNNRDTMFIILIKNNSTKNF